MKIALKSDRVTDPVFVPMRRIANKIGHSSWCGTKTESSSRAQLRTFSSPQVCPYDMQDNLFNTVLSSAAPIKPLESFGRDVFDQIAHAAGIAPLVVIPGEDFDHLAADHFCVLGVDDRGVGVFLEIGRDERLFFKC